MDESRSRRQQQPAAERVSRTAPAELARWKRPALPWVSQGHGWELEVDQYCQAVSLNPRSFSARVWNRRGSERILVPSLHRVSESKKARSAAVSSFLSRAPAVSPGLSLARTIQSCQAPVSWKGLSMRRCGIGLVFLVSCHFWTALAQNLPPTGQTLHADTGRSAAGAVSSPIGFAPGSRAIQLAAEARALTVPTPENARKWLKTITAEPHVAGTQADYKTAVFVRDRLQEWGWKADLVSYEVLLNYPIGKTSRTGKRRFRSTGQCSRSWSSTRHPCRPTRTPQAAMPSAPFTAMGPVAKPRVRSSMSITRAPKISRRSRSWASRCRARSSWLVTAAISAGSRFSMHKSMEPAGS